MKFRSIYTKNYNKVKNAYNFELYRFLKKKLVQRIENFEKQKKFMLEEDVLEDIKNKPKMRQFIT